MASEDNVDTPAVMVNDGEGDGQPAPCPHVKLRHGNPDGNPDEGDGNSVEQQGAYESFGGSPFVIGGNIKRGGDGNGSWPWWVWAIIIVLIILAIIYLTPIILGILMFGGLGGAINQLENKITHAFDTQPIQSGGKPYQPPQQPQLPQQGTVGMPDMPIGPIIDQYNPFGNIFNASTDQGGVGGLGTAGGSNDWSTVWGGRSTNDIQKLF